MLTNTDKWVLGSHLIFVIPHTGDTECVRIVAPMPKKYMYITNLYIYQYIYNIFKLDDSPPHMKHIVTRHNT